MKKTLFWVKKEWSKKELWNVIKSQLERNLQKYLIKSECYDALRLEFSCYEIIDNGSEIIVIVKI